MELTFSSLISTSITFFLIANPIGNSPAIVSLIKDFPFDRQKKIMARETLFALLLAIFFQFFGEIFLDLLSIKNYTISFCGGILLFIVALDMIFPPEHTEGVKALKKEPYFVPIATPFISGPAFLTIIMLYTQQESSIVITSSILIAWVGVAIVLMLAPYLQKLLGKRGLIALEQLMGLIVSMIAMQMMVKAITLFLKT